MRKILLTLILVMTVFMCTSCKSPVGYWPIQEIKAGEVTMTEEDGKSLGLKLGSFKLCKSGKSVVVILGETWEGTWEEKDGKIIVKYDERTATGTRDGKDMTFTDDQTVTYKCHNMFG